MLPSAADGGNNVNVRTPTGIIHYGGSCVDNYPNVEIYDQPPAGGSPVKLQRPALRAFRKAEREYAKLSGWSPGRIRRVGGRPIVLTGSWRSCAYQRELYNRDSSRYAHPDVTGHCRGIAIDVSTAQLNQTLIARALYRSGWRRVRPDDEPWHWSYGVTV
jgi:hypothetical protein